MQSQVAGLDIGAPANRLDVRRRHGPRRQPATGARLVMARSAPSTFSSESTSAYLESMSKMFESWGPVARSPTHSAGTIVRKPQEIASTTLARTQPLVTQPVTIKESTPVDSRNE